MAKSRGRQVDLPITAAVRRAADRHSRDAACLLSKRPTPRDWDRFLEATRDSLTNAPDIRRRLGRRGHVALMRGRANTAAVQAVLHAELWRAADYAVSKGNLEDLRRGKGLKEKIAACRVAAASIAISVFRCAAIERETLVDATLQLREIQHDIDALARQERVGRYPKKLTSKDQTRIRWVQGEIREWRSRSPNKPASEGLRAIFNRAKKAGHAGWPTTGALRSWINRNRIAL